MSHSSTGAQKRCRSVMTLELDQEFEINNKNMPMKIEPWEPFVGRIRQLAGRLGPRVDTYSKFVDSFVARSKEFFATMGKTPTQAAIERWTNRYAYFIREEVFLSKGIKSVHCHFQEEAASATLVGGLMQTDVLASQFRNPRQLTDCCIDGINKVYGQLKITKTVKANSVSFS